MASTPEVIAASSEEPQAPGVLSNMNWAIETRANMIEPTPQNGPIASAMITRNPDLDGIYTTWAAPAEGALAAIREAGRDDIKLVTVDLSGPLAVDMANDGPTAGMASDKVFEAGKVWAKVAGLGLLGKQGPAFAVVDTIAVTKDNLLDAWEESYGAPAPKAVKEAMGE